jgi:hypothetical protein
MAYTPELFQAGSATLRRLAWFYGKPMTDALEMLVEKTARQLPKKTAGQVCSKCRDNSICGECHFYRQEKAVKCKR